MPDSASVFVYILIDFDKYGEFDKYWGSETGKLFYAIRTTYIIAVCPWYETKYKENSASS